MTRLAAAALALVLASSPAFALKTDRQHPIDVNADRSGGFLGDGLATLEGNIEIQQGTLLIRADSARVEKMEGKVTRIELSGTPAHLQQEIEEQGLVTARAADMTYEVASGTVTLSGAADVVHPQYNISGEVLVYDLNQQHFRGSGGDDNGRIRIRLDPEMIPGNKEENAPAGDNGRDGEGEG